MKTTRQEAEKHLAADGILKNFMPHDQRLTLLSLLDGEEGDFLAGKVLEIVRTIRDTPLTYQTDDIETPDKVLHTHYFKGGIDAWIVERDVGDDAHGDGEGEQWQAFGKITAVGGGWREAEWGYISIKELIECGVELDLYWTPKTVKEMK